MLHSSQLGEQLWDQILPKLYEWQNVLKLNSTFKSYKAYSNALLHQTSVCGTKLSQKYEWLKFWKNKHQNTTFQSIWRTSSFETKFAWTNMNDKTNWKNKQWNRNKHIAIYLCTKFQSIWRTSVYEWKEYMIMNGKKFEKVNAEVNYFVYTM